MCANAFLKIDSFVTRNNSANVESIGFLWELFSLWCKYFYMILENKFWPLIYESHYGNSTAMTNAIHVKIEVMKYTTLIRYPHQYLLFRLCSKICREISLEKEVMPNHLTLNNSSKFYKPRLPRHFHTRPKKLQKILDIILVSFLPSCLLFFLSQHNTLLHSYKMIIWTINT